MTALVFPASPTPGQLFPSPAVSGVSQSQWDNVVGVWNTVATFLKLNNQNAYNSYVWPLTAGLAGQQLETDGLGGLSWEAAADPTLLPLGVQGSFDGIQSSFSLIDLLTTNVYTPTPSTNIEVILGGVPQDPFTAYTITGSIINFTNAPLANTSFFAFTVLQP